MRSTPNRLRPEHVSHRIPTTPGPAARRTPGGRWGLRRRLAVVGAWLAVLGLPASAAAAQPWSFAPESLNGAGNNRAHPRWGEAGTPYLRLTRPRYGDGIGALAAGPSPRYVSNRVFNSVGVDLFSARYVSQWGWVWGQFLDHTFGLAKTGSDPAPIPFAPGDPLERYRSATGNIAFARDAVAPGTGRSRSAPRLQTNTVSSYLNASAVYGLTSRRLDWLLQGPADGRLADSGAKLMLPGGYLPRADARGARHPAPYMHAQGQLQSQPQYADVAGDVRANDNAELTAVQTLFAREHNRIVSRLPRRLPARTRFEIARRVVIAEQQYITYTQFLPAMGVRLPRYRGYRPTVDTELSDEFSTVGYRAHSMVNGEEHMLVSSARFGAARLARLQRLGISAVRSGPVISLTLPQAAAFFNPQVVPGVGLGPLLTGLAQEPGYRNDAQIDDSLRSVLFEYPAPGARDPGACLAQESAPGCFTGVTDLGAIDIQRERDHGMPTYAQLRHALGLPRQASFDQVTGERSDRFGAGLTINDPRILAVTSLHDIYGRSLALDSSVRAVAETQRTTLAARLKAIYGSVDNLDAFVGMMSEPRLPGSEFGPVQLALWQRQFAALRDGDRFFYARDRGLAQIQRRFGITYRHTLGQLISLDAGVPARQLPRNVFFAPAPPRG
ncbi:MAG: peroxidase [Solirubrobacteraceae bacterium]|nr:peroxidase [Solirubrobacteraceae bacterium]